MTPPTGKRYIFYESQDETVWQSDVVKGELLYFSPAPADELDGDNVSPWFP